MDRLHCILREYRIRMSGIRNLLLNIGFRLSIFVRHQKALNINPVEDCSVRLQS